jgi:hypothetical protein
VAGEVDGWCTRCRLVLNHRIVSMKSGKPHQVECLTCRSQHLWRPGAPGEKRAGAGNGGDEKASTSAAKGAPRAARVSGATKHVQLWEKATLGRAVGEFKAYSVGANFREGDLLRHKKFGDGLVTRVIDASKVEVLFRDEVRTLAQGMT